MIAGIAGGLGNYLGIDPVLVRLAIVVLTIAGGAGILAYIIGWLIIPEEPYAGAATDDEPDRSAARHSAPATGPRIVVGIVMIVIGISLLLKWVIPAFSDVFWPIAVIIAGAALLLHGARR